MRMWRRAVQLKAAGRRFKSSGEGDNIKEVAKALKTAAEKQPCIPPPGARSVPAGERGKAKVTLLAATDPVGQATALLLKVRGGLVGELRLWDKQSGLRELASDLSLIPTSVKTYGYVGDGQLKQALKESDIVVVLGGEKKKGGKGTDEDLFLKNCEYVRGLTRSVILHAPQALIALTVQPITSIVAFAAEMQMMEGNFCSNKLLGPLALQEMRLRCITGRRLCLPASVMTVRITGGGNSATLVPALSTANPGGEFLKDDLKSVTEELRGFGDSTLAAGIALADFVRAAAQGLVGGERPVVTAVVRTNQLHGVPYLSMPVVLGPGGIQATAGLPPLNKQELKLLLEALPKMRDEIALGETWAHIARQRDLSVSLAQ